MELEYASKGVGAAGLTTGIIGTSLGALNALGGAGGLGGLLGLGRTGDGCCSENHAVNRYELKLEQELASQKSENALLKANIYNDQKNLEMYQYVDGRLRGIESQLCQQAVVNAQLTANISCMQTAINTLNGLTKTVIPIGNVCPAPMPQYNSWTAPTAEAPAAG